MPGLKIVVGPPPSSGPRPESDRFAPDVPLERVEVFRGSRTEVLFEAPPHVPRLSASGSGFTCFLEGAVYDRSDEELRAFAASLAGKARAGEPLEAAVRGFMSGTDGEYVFVLVLEGGARVVVFNDAWGRLPLYAARWPSVFALAREPADLLPRERAADAAQRAVAARTPRADGGAERPADDRATRARARVGFGDRSDGGDASEVDARLRQRGTRGPRERRRDCQCDPTTPACHCGSPKYRRCARRYQQAVPAHGVRRNLPRAILL